MQAFAKPYWSVWSVIIFPSFLVRGYQIINNGQKVREHWNSLTMCWKQRKWRLPTREEYRLKSEELRVYGSPGYGNYPTGPRTRGRETLSQAALLLITGRDNMGTWRLTTTPAGTAVYCWRVVLLRLNTSTPAVKDTAHFVQCIPSFRLDYSYYVCRMAIGFLTS